MVVRAFGCLLVVIALVACGGDAADRLSEEDLPSLVLQPSDLPGPFIRFDAGEIGFTDIQPGARGDERRFGRKGGWKARYRRPGSAETAGPLVVVSMVDLFEDEDGARRDLDAYESELTEDLGDRRGTKEVAPPNVGQGAVAVTRGTLGGSAGIRYVSVAWRQANATAFVSASGFERKFAMRDALALVRAQERRIRRALD